MPLDASEPSIDDILCTSKTEYRILLEMKLIASEFATGSIYVMPTKPTSLIWDGVIFVRSGVYKNGIFRFTIHLEASFPSQKSVPIIKLLSPLLHPLISEESFLFDSSSAFPAWSENDHIYEVLKFFKYCIENIDYCFTQVKRFSNSNAVELYTNDRNNFIKMSQEIVAKSVNGTFNSDPLDDQKQDVFTFDKSTVDETLHDQILENMKSLSDSCDTFSFSSDRRG